MKFPRIQNLIGVRPSSVAATSGYIPAAGLIHDFTAVPAAATGDGRTPLQKTTGLCRAAAILFIALATFPATADVSIGNAPPDKTTGTPAERQQQLIAILKSDAKPQDKAVACKRLAVYGDRESVPFLAPLLSDEHLASWARIALEAIPGSAPDSALRQAATKLNGRLLVGVINSIGVRQDTRAIGILSGKLKDADPEVASAAAVALGHIGGSKAAKSLTQYLPSAPENVRSAVAQGCILCGESFMAQKKSSDAVKIYDFVRDADVPKQRILEAIRGAILARGPEGLPLLKEQLASTDKALYGIGLRTARELPGRKITEALATELDRSTGQRQGFLLLAISDRHDDAVLPIVLRAASNGAKELRLVAIGILDRRADVFTTPTLLEVAASNDDDLAQAAQAALARMPGTQVDAEVLAKLPKSTGNLKKALINLAAQRRIHDALLDILRSASDSDAGVRTAAVQAIGVLGTERQAGDLARLLGKTKDSKERADIEIALIALSGRTGPSCVQNVAPLTRDADNGLRVIGLHALAAAGGPDALTAVRIAADDPDETVQDEAVRTLSTWPNNWPEDAGITEPLLAVAKSDRKTSHQVLALRGYLSFLKNDKKLKETDKVAKVQEIMPLLKRPEEKRAAIAVIDSTPSASTFELLASFASDSAVADDACAAILKLAGKNPKGVSKEDRKKALEAVVEKSQSDETKKKAEDLLKKIG
jgi:HEAT repeat protein